MTLLCLSSSSESLSQSFSLSQGNGNNSTQYSNLSQNNNLTPYNSLSQGNGNNSTQYNSLSQSCSLSQSEGEWKCSLSSSQSLSSSTEKTKQVLRNKIEGENQSQCEPRKKSKRAALRRDDMGTTSYDPRYKVETPDLSTLPTEKANPNYTIAKAKINVEFNRYHNILPEDDKIYAPSCYTHQGKEIKLKDYYLNAVFIPLMLEEKLLTYVATQAPKENCFNEFWKAVIAGQSDTIVNLAMPLEENKLKCDDYWSHQYWKNQEHFTIMDGNTVLGTLTKDLDIPDEILECSGEERLVKRQFEFTSHDENEKRIITQFHYENWPDGDVPEDVLLFEKLIEVVNKSGSKKGPPIIHCSAGIGRTGTFIVTDYLLKQIKEQMAKQIAPRVDPMQIILKCRQYRKGIVQSQEQLEMIYKMIFRFCKTLSKETYYSQNLITNLNKV